MNQDLEDRLEIADLISGVGRCLDEHDWDGLRGLFTEDAAITTPGGTTSGHDGLVDQARRRHETFLGTQHIITNVLVRLDGDVASARANLLVSFAQSGPPDPAPFQLGEVYRFGVARTGDGWRLSALSSTPLWSRNLPSGLQVAGEG